MAEEYEDKILNHNYDGIQEYDNPMPGWWKALFVITVIWAGFYLVAIELGYLPKYGDDLKSGQAEIVAMRQAYEDAQPPIVVDEAMLLAAAADPAQVSQGGELFQSTCASCHGAQAQGGIGPNLTDDYWLYGPDPMTVHTTIRKGTSKGMPPWESVFKPAELVALVAFVGSVRGTTPAGAKDPQGEKYEVSAPAQAP